MPQLHEYINRAVEELESPSTSSSTFGDNYDKFDILVDLIADETALDPGKLRISEDSYKERIADILEEIADAENLVSEFHSQLDELEEEIENNWKEFRILFPLNFHHQDLSSFDSLVTVRDVEFCQISESLWKEFEEKAADQDSFDEFLDKLPTREYHTNPLHDQRYWETEYEAFDSEFVINRVEYALEILLGKIAFASHAFRITESWDAEIWRYGTIRLQRPICYIVSKNDEYLKYYIDDDYKPRKPYSLNSAQRENFEELYPQIPKFQGKLTELDNHLTTAFRSYFSAISEANDEQAFLNYWRCLEAATLTTDERYGAEDPLKRARAAARPDLGIEINNKRIELLTEKRNSLVHEGGQVNITGGDRQYLKTLSEYALFFLITDREEYSLEEFQDFYKFGAKHEDSILQAKANREKDVREKREEIEQLEDEVERIDQVMQWLEIKED